MLLKSAYDGFRVGSDGVLHLEDLFFNVGGELHVGATGVRVVVVTVG